MIEEQKTTEDDSERYMSNTYTQKFKKEKYFPKECLNQSGMNIKIPQSPSTEDVVKRVNSLISNEQKIKLPKHLKKENGKKDDSLLTFDEKNSFWLYNGKKIDESKLINHKEFIPIVKSLKNKLTEFKLLNDEKYNIYINQISILQKSNEMYLNKIDELYKIIDELSNSQKKGNQNINYYDNTKTNDNNILAENFRNNFLKKNYFNLFREKIARQKEIKKKYRIFQLEKNAKLKIKIFCLFKRFHTMNLRRKKFEYKYNNKLKKLGFNIIKKNLLLQKKLIEFKKFQTNINIIYSFATIKYYSFLNAKNKINVKKSIYFYNLKAKSKILKLLLLNFHNKIKKIQSENNSINLISFSRFLQKKYPKILLKHKQSKIKGLNILSNIFNRLDSDRKIKNNENILRFYYIEWKKISTNDVKIIQYKKKLFKKDAERFFRLAKNNKHYNKNYLIHLHNKKIINYNIRSFFSIILKERTITKSLLYFEIKQSKRVYVNFFKNLKINQKNKLKKQILTANISKFQTMQPIINYKFFFVKCYNILSKKNYIKNNLNIIAKKFYCSGVIHHLLMKSFNSKILNMKQFYEKSLHSFNDIIIEKKDIINKFENENKKLNQFKTTLEYQLKNLTNENRLLREEILNMRSEKQNEKLLKENIIIENNKNIVILKEKILEQKKTIEENEEREKKLQQKYIDDIQKALSLNKHLNEIINKKTKEIIDIQSKNKVTNNCNRRGFKSEKSTSDDNNELNEKLKKLNQKYKMNMSYNNIQSEQ